MKAIIKASIWLALCSFVATAHASLLEVTTYNTITYFADDQSSSLKRYSLADEKFLAPITLTANPKAVHVDETGIYVSYGTSIVKLNLEGGNATEIRVTSTDIYDIESTDKYLVLAGYSYLYILNKANGTSVTTTGLWYTSPYISLSGDNSQIFTTSAGISPADIYQIPFTSNGTLGVTTESPYHGSYNIGDNAVAFPTQSRVVDSSGNVYNTMDLTFVGSLGGFYQDIGFWQGLPIVLRGNALFSYNQALLETGTYALSVPAQKIAVYLNKVFVFGFDNNGVLTANKYDVALISPADPVAAINPTNLPYTPDEKALDKNQDTLYLLSKTSLNIFRWSVNKAAYLTSIPLANAPLQFSYSADQERIYLGYANGAVNYIDLKDNKEYPFANVGGTVYALTAAGQYVVVKGPTGAWGSLSVFNKEGTKTDYRDWVEPTSAVVWNSTYSRIFYISEYSPPDLHWIQLDTNTGKFGQGLDSPYHESNGWANPIRISETGKLIALGSGRVVDGKSMTQQALFYPYTYFNDVAWLHGNVFTIKGIDSNTYTQLERWQANYTRDDSATYEVQGSPIGLVPISSTGKLVFIYSRNGKPRFEILNYSVIDSDKDGYPDGVDAMPNNAAEWLDFDDDSIGDNADTDDDNDGVSDTQDAFPLNASETLDTDKDGRGNNADTDDDNDGVLDDQDAFPLNPLESKDMDNDGIGDNSDTDIDGDGALNVNDPFPLNRNESLDTDKDGIGNNADTDDDNDSVLDIQDKFPLNSLESKDLDNDGIGDNSDIDIDGDGAFNISDPFPLDRNESLDTDKDGIGNNADTDDDNDGVPDSSDFYPIDASKSVLKAADFFPMRKGSSWIYDFDIQASLNADANIAGKSLMPLTFQSGYKLYFNLVDNQIQFFGFYLPRDTSDADSYAIDLTLNKGVNLTSSNYSSGTGNVNITPTYGNKELKWNASTQYMGSESLVVPAGKYTAIHTSLNFSGSVTIDGETIPLTYTAEFWFAENVGIVKMIENGYLINLVSANIPAVQAGGSEGGSTSSAGSGAGGSGGSSGGGGSIGWLTLALLLAFCTPSASLGSRKTRKSH